MRFPLILAILQPINHNIVKAKDFLLLGVILFPIILDAQDYMWFEKALNVKDQKERIEYYSNSIKYEGTSFAAYNNRGLAKYQLRDYHGAVRDFNKSIEIEPKIAIAYLYRGNANKCLQNYDRAISDYKKHFELTPHAFIENTLF
jgi:tetratricopeptide (TPR) repeat protein